MLQNELKAMLNKEECIGVPADEEYQEYLIDYILDENLFENELSDYCVDVLEKRGVEFIVGTPIKEIKETSVVYEQNDELKEVDSHTIIWTTGVRGSSVIGASGFDERRGRVMVNSTLTVPEHEDIFMIEDASFHEGIIGLVAGSICASFNKPCIVLAKNEQGYKASMRSPEGFNCMDFLGEYPHFVTFGGHENAAGFSLNLNEFDLFEKFIYTRIKEYTYSVKKKNTLVIDDEELSLKTIQSLDILRPFGPGFVFPSFEIVHPKIKSLYDFQNHKHRKYTLESGLQCMRFNQSEAEYKKSVNAIYSFIGTVQINQYQGRKQVNFVIDEIVYA